MKQLRNAIFIFLAVFILIYMSGCGHTSKTNKKNTNEIKFDETMVISTEDKYENVYSLNDKTLKLKGKINNIQNVKYIQSNGIKVYVKKISEGLNLTNNYIEIQNGDKSFNIKGNFSYSDVKLSPSGNFIAFRSYKTDDVSSAQGLSVYNTKTGKKVNFDNKVTVSGNLYCWNDDALFYYGVESGDNGYGKIYKYDFKNKSKKVVMDNFTEYCTYFIPMKNGNILYLQNNGSSNNLYYYNTENKSNKIVYLNLDEILDYSKDEKRNVVYIIAKEDGSETSLYNFDLVKEQFKKITYDFPSSVDGEGGISVNSSGEVYFLGFDNLNSIENYIYMYNENDGSINIVSPNKGIYHIIESTK